MAGRDNITVDLLLEDGRFKAALAVAVAEATAAADEMDHEFDKVDRRMSVMGSNTSGLREFDKAINQSTVSLGPFTASIINVPAIAAVASSSLVAVGAATIGLVGSLGEAIVALGALGVAAGSLLLPGLVLAIGAVKGFEGAVNAGNASAIKLQNAMTNLGKSFRDATGEMNARVYNELANFMGNIARVLIFLKSAFDGFGTAVAQSLRRIGDEMGNETWVAFWQQLINSAAAVMPAITTLFLYFSNLLREVVSATLPIFINLMNSAAAAVSSWHLPDIAGLQRGIAGLVGVLGTWLGIIVDLSIGLGSLFAQAATGSDSLLTSLAGVAAGFRAWTSSAAGREAIRAFFARTIPLAEALFRGVWDLLGAFVSFGAAAAPAVTGVINVLDTVLQKLNDISPAIGSAVGGFLLVGPAISLIGRAAGIAGAGLSVLATASDYLAISALIAGSGVTFLDVALAVLLSPITLVVAAIAGIVAAFIFLKPQLISIGNAIWSIVKPAWDAIVLAGHFLSDMISNFLVPAFTYLWKQIQPLLPILRILAIVVGVVIVAPILIAVAALVALAGVAAVVVGALGYLVGFIVKALIATFHALVAAAVWVGNAMADTFNFIVGVVSFAIGIVVDILKVIAGVFYVVFLGIQAFVNAVVVPIFTFIMGIVMAFWSFWSFIFNAIFQIVFTVLQTIVTLIIITFVTIGYYIIQGLTIAYNFLAGIFTAIYNFIAGILSAVYNFVAGIFSAIYNTVAGWVSAAYNFIASIFSAIYNFIAGIVHAVFSTVSGVFSSIYSTVAGIVSGLFNTVVSTFSGIASAITGAISDAYNAVAGFIGKFLQIGKDIINGIVQGVKSAGSAIIDAVLSVLPGPVRAALGALGIHSPSRLYAEKIGQPISLGIAAGILEAGGAITDAVQNVLGVPALASLSTGYSASGSLDVSHSGDVGGAVTSGIGSGANINQTNIINTPVDMDLVNKDLAWRIRR